ncbi:TetR/AcrR family transcriptional regulator [Sphingobacterium multivorum]|uniref:TetR/AcrR family transcriptional regulator n=1 Tax=Sphingobacterium multivorum TaxID=28454 RepID=UPI00345E407B
MTKAEQTRQYIIETTAPIFNIKGYENTSLADVQEATKLTKGAIYGNFSDKKELVIAAYNYNYSRLIETIEAMMSKQPSAKEAIVSYVNFYVKNWKLVFQRGGCPIMNASIEADDYLHFLKNSVQNSMKKFIGLLQHKIEEGQSNGEFSNKVDAAEYASMIFATMEGSILLAKTMNDKKYFKFAADRITFIVEKELTA